MKFLSVALAAVFLFAGSTWAQTLPGPPRYPSVQNPLVPPTSVPNSRQSIQQPVPAAAQLPQYVQPGIPPQGQYPVPGQPQVLAQPLPQTPAVLSKAQLRDIDRLVVQLSGYCRQMHDEFHEHFEGERHAAKLDEDVTALEHMADGLHQFATTADGSPQSIARLRHDTNTFLQLSVRIGRTIDLTEPWLRNNNSFSGVRHMREIGAAVMSTALQIDRYLPVDTQVIDGQAENLEAAVKELHDEFHEHLEGYEVSQHLDEDLEEVETLVEHMHELAHDRQWGQIDFNHLLEDINEVRQKTAHIESLFVRQAQIGVRTQDWIGIEHSRDAITDVLSSAYLLEHMIRKTVPVSPYPNPVTPYPGQDLRPKRDRHGHEIRQPDLHPDHYAPPVQQPYRQPYRG